jgi:hypothetical protein
VSGRYGHVSLALLQILLLAACASNQGKPGGAPSNRTLIKTFHAFQADGDLAVRVADVGYGRCWTMSIAAPGSGAYRCLSGNAILDPCFVSPRHTEPIEVECVADPWSRAEVLQLTSALPKPPAEPDGPNRPWALELGNGTECVAATGMVPAVRGVNLGYHCRDGHDAGALDTAGSVATAKYADPGAKTLSSVSVTTIWRI